MEVSPERLEKAAGVPVYGERFLCVPAPLTRQQRRLVRVRAEAARRERECARRWAARRRAATSRRRLRPRRVHEKGKADGPGEGRRAEEAVRVSLPSPADPTPRPQHPLTLASPPPPGARWPGVPAVPVGRSWAPPVTEGSAAGSQAALRGVMVPRQHGAAVLWRQEGTLSYLQFSLSYIRFFAFAERRHGGATAALLEAVLRCRGSEGLRGCVASLVRGACQLLPYAALGWELHLPE